MNEIEPPKKRRFWHPYTVIAFSFVVMVLLTLNGWERFHYASPVEKVYGIGFPFVFQDTYGVGASLDANPAAVNTVALLYDAIIGTVLSCATAITSEFLIRRREGRKP